MLKCRSETIQSQIIERQIIALNKKYKPLSASERIKELYNDFDVNEVMLTSSFAATSAFFPKLFSEANKKQKVFFIDTGYHFDDTIDYKNKKSSRKFRELYYI